MSAEEPSPLSRKLDYPSQVQTLPCIGSRLSRPQPLRLDTWAKARAEFPGTACPAGTRPESRPVPVPGVWTLVTERLVPDPGCWLELVVVPVVLTAQKSNPGPPGRSTRAAGPEQPGSVSPAAAKAKANKRPRP